MHRYERFMARHSRLALALTAAGLISLVIGAAGVPSDIEAWGDAFTWLGSDGGRWLLAASGFCLMVAVAVAPRLASADKFAESPASGTFTGTKGDDAGQLRLEFEALGDLRAGSESIFEVRFNNSTERNLTNVAVNVDVPQGFEIRRSTQNGGNRPGGSVLTSGNRRFWQGIVSPLRGFGTTTVEHFAVAPDTAGDFDLILKIQLDGGAWEGWSQTFSAREPSKPDSPGDSAQTPAHDLADFYKEGDRLREECKPPDDASTMQLLMWNLGGNPRQIELEQKAREWDAAVSGYLWGCSELKVLGPDGRVLATRLVSLPLWTNPELPRRRWGSGTRRSLQHSPASLRRPPPRLARHCPPRSEHLLIGLRVDGPSQEAGLSPERANRDRPTLLDAPTEGIAPITHKANLSRRGAVESRPPAPQTYAGEPVFPK